MQRLGLLLIPSVGVAGFVRASTTMASSTAGPDWQACLTVWSCEEGKAFLSSEPEEATSLLRTGPIQDLLAKTQKLLAPALMQDSVGFEQASAAVGMHILSYMSKFTRILFHLAALCDSLRCGAYGTYCYGIS